MSAVPPEEIILGEFIDSTNLEDSSISYEILVVFNLITGEIIIANELMSRHVNIEGTG